MTTQSDIPADKLMLLDEVCAALREVPDVVAIALGGSHARGTHTSSSDLDIGLYYFEHSPFDIEAIRKIARQFAPNGEPTVTGFYEWGPFVNGGAWIENPVCKIDFLYRNTMQLTRTIAEAENGIWSHSFDQQPPFGFRSVTTLGEIHCSKPLYDPAVWLAAQKKRVARYPVKLKQRIIQDTLWAAEFAFIHADIFARSGEVPNTVGCMTRIYHYLVHALFAINERYPLNDKRVAAEMESFAQAPPNFGSRISAILAQPGGTPDALDVSLRKLRMLFQETTALSDRYVPRFKPPQGA